jgi:uncharacterized membrane protein YdbT with pleckstrin-like domain
MDSFVNYDNHLWNKPSFPNRISDDEDIVFIVREDLVVLFVNILVYFLIFFAFGLVRIVLAGWLNDTQMGLYDSVYFIINIILLTAFTLFFHNYYLSMQVVTSERIIDIDQKGIFLREVNEMPIENIEDVSYKQNGFWGTIFNFGNVIVQTAGSGSTSEDPNNKEDASNGFVFNNVPTPSDIANKISVLREQNKHNDMKNQSMYHVEALNDSKVHYGDEN